MTSVDHLDTFSILKAASSNAFVHLDKSTLLAMYDRLVKIDRNFKRIGPKISKENIREEWAHILKEASFVAGHPFFCQEKSVDPLNLILKRYRAKDIYHRITVSNLDEIKNKFKKVAHDSDLHISPAANEKVDEIDEGTDCNSENSDPETPVGSSKKIGPGRNSLGLGFEHCLDAASDSTSKTKSFFDDLKRESKQRMDEQLNQLKKSTNQKIDDQLDFLTTKFCAQLDIIEKDVAVLDTRVTKIEKATLNTTEKLESHSEKLTEIDAQIKRFNTILNVQENINNDEFHDIINSPGEYRARYFNSLAKEMAPSLSTVAATEPAPIENNFDIQSFEHQANMARRKFYNAIHH